MKHGDGDLLIIRCM